MITVSVSSKTSGPLFDGRAQAALARGCDAAREEVASRGDRLVRSMFLLSIRDNHGHFMSSITTIHSSRVFNSRGGHQTYTMPVVVEDRATDIVVTSSLATYGPWLEGTGSRNHTTRFKGYHGYRRASEVLDRIARPVAEAALEPFVREMN